MKIPGKHLAGDLALGTVSAQRWRLGGLIFLSLLCCFSLEAEARLPKKVPSFREAYLQERAELLLSRDSLQKTLRRLRQQNLRRRKRLTLELGRLVRLVQRVRQQNSRLEEALSQQKERWGATTDHKALLRSTLRLAGKSLRRQGGSLSITGEAPRDLRHLVQQGVTLLRRFSTIHQQKGTFFGPEGRQVQGRLLWVGRVGVLGLTPEIGGVLQQAPGGGLRLRAPYNSPSYRLAASRLARQQTLPHIPLFLFDPLGKSKPSAPPRDLRATIDAGGPIAWIIVSLALLGLLLVLERLLTLSRLSNWKGRHLAQLNAHAAQGKLEDAARLSKRMGAVSAVLSEVLQHAAEDRLSLEERASEVILQKMPALERSMSLLGVLVTVAPLLGLLGTVTGMISTFDVITEHGTGNPRLLSHGISEALITTKLGLSVAVPFLLLKSFLSRWSDRIVEAMEAQSLSLINALSTRQESVSPPHQESE